jgi:hypothetical protein
MKTIYCPACGVVCKVIDRLSEEMTCQCRHGHRWAVLLDFKANTSDDGTSIISFQCDNTSAYDLPDAT